MKKGGGLMRTIDADRLLEEKRIHTYYHLPNGDIAIPLIDIKNAPTIEPRKKGKWIDDDGNAATDKYCATCSACGEWSEYLTAYCPNCGAEMRKDGATNADVES